MWCCPLPVWDSVPRPPLDRKPRILSMSTAEIIAVGSELLLGGRVETNSIVLSELLAGQGIAVRFKSVVGDVVDDVAAAVTQAAKRVPFVLLTGGLGPTVDDVTREAVAKATGKPLRLRPSALKAVTARLQSMGWIVSGNQRRQAFLPAGSDLLHNPAGTAPGFSLPWKHCRIFCLPGVGHEARVMLTESVLPMLRRAGADGPALETRVIHTWGLAEGEVDRRIQGIVPARGPFRLGLLASPLGVSVSLTRVRPPKSQPGAALKTPPGHPRVSLDGVMDDVTGALGAHVFSVCGQNMETVVGRRLRERGLTLAVAESCTGGLIGHRLTSVAGSSAYVDRGVVCYSDQAKRELLGVAASLLRRHGAVSAQVAGAMAEGMRARSRADVGLSVTGLAGPGGGTARKPVGLVYVGLAASKQSLTKEFRFHGDRQTITLRSSQGALDVLRRWLGALPLDGG